MAVAQVKESIEYRLELISKFKKKLLINDVFEAIFAMVGLIMAYYEYEYHFSEVIPEEGDDNTMYSNICIQNGAITDGSGYKCRYQDTTKNTILRVMVSLSTVVIICLAVRHYYLSYVLAYKSGKLVEQVAFWRSGYFKTMFWEILLNVVHNFPKVDYIFYLNNQGRQLRYSINLFILIFMFGRIYLFMRLVTRFTKWRTDQADLICSIEGLQANTGFALKCLMKEQPYMLLFIMSMLSSVLFGFMIRIFELPYYEDSFMYEGVIYTRMDEDSSTYQDYTYAWNGWWLVMVTMTTVGFGDYSPKTYFGRCTIVIACFSGIFLVSMTMVTLGNSKEYSVLEHKSFTLVQRIKIRKNVNKLAGLSILAFLRQVKSRQKSLRDPSNPIFKTDSTFYEETCERLIEMFKQSRMVLQPEEVPQEEKMRMITEKVEGDIKRIGLELQEYHKNEQILSEIILSQRQTKDTLKVQITNFKKMEIAIGRLDFAYKFGPLKVLNLTKQIEEEERYVQEIKFQQIQREKSSKLGRLRHFNKKDINQIIAEVEDKYEEDLTKEEIQRKITRIQTILENLDDEEEKASDSRSRSKTVSLRSSTNKIGNRPRGLTLEESYIKEDDNESVSVYSGDILQLRNEKIWRDEQTKQKLLHGYSQKFRDTSPIIKPKLINREISSIAGLEDSQNFQSISSFSLTQPSLRKGRSQNRPASNKNNNMISNQQLRQESVEKAHSAYLREKKNEQAFILRMNQDRLIKELQKRREQEIHQDHLVIKRMDTDKQFQDGTPQVTLAQRFFYQNQNDHQQKPERKGYQPDYIRRQIEEKQNSNKETGFIGGPVGNFSKYYKEVEMAQEQEYEERMQKVISQERKQAVNTRMRPTSEEMRIRQQNRSGIGAFNKALRQVLKPPGS